MLAGYGYLLYSMVYDRHLFDTGFTPCLFKNITGLPCPSCGATRSLACILHGQLLAGLYWNPIGLLLLAGMIIIPVLLVYDLLKSKNTYLTLYTRLEQFMRRKPVMYTAICLLLINWLWNINKGL